MSPILEYLQNLAIQFGDFLPRLALGALIFIIAWIASRWISRLVRRSMQRSGRDPELIVLLSLLARWGVLVLGIVIGSPSSTLDTLPRPEIFWLLAFFGAANDRIAERVLSAVTGWGIRLFEPSTELEREEADETATEPDEKEKEQDV